MRVKLRGDFIRFHHYVLLLRVTNDLNHFFVYCSEQGETKEKEIPDSKTITHLKPIAKFSHDEEVGVKEKYEYEKTYSPMNDRKEKEVLLAKLLNIKELSSEEMTPNFPEIPVMNPRLLCGNNSVDLPKTEESTCSDINNDILDINADLGFSRDENCNISLNEDNSLPYRDIYCSNYINHRERKEDENEISVIPTSECCSYLSYGPPSGSSNLASITSEALHTDRSSGVPCSLPQLPPVLKNQLLDVDAGANAYSLPSDLTKCLSNTPSDFPTDIISSVPNDKIKTEYNSVWIQYKPPGYLSSLSVCDQYIVCTDVKDVVYYASFDGLGLEWHKTNYFARQVSKLSLSSFIKGLPTW